MKYIPNYVYKCIYDIDFDTLYESGKRIILSDLDNTIAPYDEKEPSVDTLKWNEELRKKGLKIYLVSNNNDLRIKEFSKEFIIDGYLYHAKKPFIKKLTKFLKDKDIKKEEVISIGDQIVTDIIGFNKLGVDSILVKTINQDNQKWYTKINRLREKRILKKIKKVDYGKYNQIKELYE